MDMEGWGYAIVPKGAIRNRREKMIFMCLIEESAFAETGSLKAGEVLINVSEFARDASMDERKVRYSLKKLEEAGFIKTRRLKQNRGMIVTILNYEKLQNTRNYGKKKEPTPAPTEEKEDDKDMQTNPFRFFEEEGFGYLSSFLADMLSSLIDDYGEEKVLDAMKEAVKRNARNMAYVQRILQSNEIKSKEWGNGYPAAKKAGNQGGQYKQNIPKDDAKPSGKISPLFGPGRIRRKG